MATSGTYSFNPGMADIVLSAYARCGLRRPSLTAEHFADADRESNYLLAEWSNKQPMLFTSELQEIPLTQGVVTYSVDPEVVMIIIGYISTTSNEVTTDRVVTAVSTVEYASFPNKEQQGTPTVYWFNRLINPEVKIWLAPDNNGPYTLKLRTVRRQQDAKLPSGTTLDAPFRYFDAFVAGLAHRLARIHAPALEAMRKQDAKEAWDIAATQDTENVGFYIIPQLSSYFR